MKFNFHSFNEKNPIRVLENFLKTEKALNLAKNRKDIRFVGYVMDIEFKRVEVITSDPFKLAVGGIPRNSFLIMIPDDYEGLPLHFTVLRVVDTTDVPLKKEIQQTFFELQKNSMPEIDLITQNELQWSALNTEVLGMFYPNPDNDECIEFSSDLNNFVSPYKYKIFASTNELLHLIVNATIPNEQKFEIGKLRMTENRLNVLNQQSNNIPIYVSVLDFLGTRTALFGKTRLGKSNIVKLIAQSLIKASSITKNVGQIIFDVNGEYANDNPQDGNLSLRSMNPEHCIVYSLTPKPNTESKLMKVNFFSKPQESHQMLAELLKQNGRDTSIYVESFLSVTMPSNSDISDPLYSEEVRKSMLRKILIYWTILYKAGFEFKKEFKDIFEFPFDEELRKKATNSQKLKKIKNITDLAYEIERIATYLKKFKDLDEVLSEFNSAPLDYDDLALFHFLAPPRAGSGTAMIQGFRKYHDVNSGFFIDEIIKLVSEGKTVILDLGSADQEIMQYYSNRLSVEIFEYQVKKFTNNELGNHYIQLYFEEAHNLFPANETNGVSIYRRIAKEGAKYHIGMVYSTQSVTTINKDLLSQTENFFIVHLSSKEEVKALANVNSSFEGLEQDILSSKTPGFARILTRSHRFAVPIQANRFKKKGE